MGLIKSIFKSRDTPKNHMGDNVGGGRYFPFGRTWSGKSVTERSAMQTTAVYAAHLGLPIPSKLKDILEQLHDRAEEGDNYE